MGERLVLNAEELKQHARNLALGHVPVYRKWGDKRLKKFRAKVDDLEAFSRELWQDIEAGFAVPPAAEWLLDHMDFLSEQALYVEQNFPRAYYRRLPKWDKGDSSARISVLLPDFLHNTDGQVQIGMLEDFFQAFQEVSPLTMGELWAIPLVLRMSVLEELEELFAEVRQRHETKKQAERLILKWAPHFNEPVELNFALAQAEKELATLSPALVVYLSGELRGYGEEAQPVRRWLERKMEMQAGGLEKLVSLEHRLQARYQVAAGDLITSLREISRWFWAEHFESLSTVEQILRRDPAGVYPLMDFASRDNYRHIVEKLAQHLHLPESLIAVTTLNLAMQIPEDAVQEEWPKRHLGYYLLDLTGKESLYMVLKEFRRVWQPPVCRLKRFPTVTYLGLMVLMTGLFLRLFWYITLGRHWVAGRSWFGLILLLLIPASEWSWSIVNKLVQKLFPPQLLPRLEYAQGVTEDAKTMVVVPSFLSHEAEVTELLQRLEVHYLANQDPNLHFAVLGDFRDAPVQNMPGDEQILYAAKLGIEALNAKYPSPEGSTFYLMIRHRLWNPKEGVWMGWERKRGKLMELNALLRGDTETGFSAVYGDPGVFPHVRFVITLDADTELPREAAKRLIGTLAHPLNAPVLNKEETRVIRGHGLLQPRILVKHNSRFRSRLANWFAGLSGIDPYSFAISDSYQDLFGHGIFTGKGIYDVAIFDRVLGRRIPDNTVLSHDLLEGGFLRAGLVTDIELFDDYPANYISFLQRLHRWVRGDWQLLRWFAPFVRNRAGEKERVDLPVITRWQMLDNLRRSLLNPALMATFFGGLTIFPGDPRGWIMVTITTTLIPFWLYFLGSFPQRLKWRWRWYNALTVITQVGFSWLMLPFQSIVMLDAIGRTLYRMLISKKHLLEWVTAADSERRTPKTIFGCIRYFSKGYVLIFLFLGCLSVSNPNMLKLGLPISLLWLTGPLAAYWLSRPQPEVIREFSREESAYWRTLALDIWRFFETVAGPGDHWLPPDNLQIDPPNGLAHRTSPTNIGLLLASTVTARDMGYITTPEMISRLGWTIETLEGLECWHGHFYNWYDTLTLRPLQPYYVSTVDSGNLAAYLIAVKEGVQEWLERPLFTTETVLGMLDRIKAANTNQQNEDLQTWQTQLAQLLMDSDISIRSWYRLLTWAAKRDLPDEVGQKVKQAKEEIEGLIPSQLRAEPDNQGWAKLQGVLEENGSITLQGILTFCLNGLDRTEQSNPAPTDNQEQDGLLNTLRAVRGIIEQGEDLLKRLERLIQAPDFKLLYDEKKRLLAIGYNISSLSRDTSCYDLLASEARQASFVAIALGQLPTAHWFALGRTLTKVGRETALLSWSGTMFEYFMPLLLMDCFRNTLWEETYKAVVSKQISYAAESGLPWGISESGFYAFDFQMNYQYQAFGVPGLGLKRGLEQDRVIAPYATMLAALLDPKTALENLRVLEGWGMRGSYGFYEAVDFTPERLPEMETSLRIKSYMAHHQGMGLVAIGNLVAANSLGVRFHHDSRIQATELLLQERIPQRPVVLPRPKKSSIRNLPRIRQEQEIVRHFPSPTPGAAEARILSNGRYLVMLTSGGGGFSRLGDLALTRWREDPVGDCWGTFFYIRDVRENRFWSAAYQPCHVQAPDSVMHFALGKVTYERTDGDIHTVTEIAVASELDAEVRRLSLTNRGDNHHLLEVTSYFEVVLGLQAVDDAHPAFHKLFVHTEYCSQPEALLAYRRGRSPGDNYPWLTHSVSVEGKTVGGLEYETDRGIFLGRGHSITEPAAIVENRRLSGKTGAVLDPVMSLRRRVEVAPGETVRLTFVTGAAETRAKALELVQKLRDPHQVHRTFQLAWTRSRIELHYLNLSLKQADLFQWMLSQIFYFSPFRSMRAENMKKNDKGQSSLWTYGLSGDFPVVLVHIAQLENLDFVRTVLRAHEYWRLKGLKVDLVILNHFAGGYEQPLLEALRHLVYASSDRDFMERPGGVFIRAANLMPPEDKVLLESIARLSLNAERGNLKVQMAMPPEQGKFPAAMPSLGTPGRPEQVSFACLEQLEFFNGLGGFLDGGKEYAIFLREKVLPPVPWINILANPRFGCLISESGAGYTWAENSRENKLSPWSNDPILDAPGEACYLRDEATGEFWSLTPAPVREESPYLIYHGWGYTRFEHQSHGLLQKSRVYIPREDPLKIWEITLKNNGEETRPISLTYYVEWVLGDRREANAPFIVTEIEPDSGALLARNIYQEAFRERVAFLQVLTVEGGGERSWTGDRMEFLGRNRTLKEPVALTRVSLANSTGAIFNPCGAMQIKFELKAHTEKTVLVLLGEAHSQAQVRELLKKYSLRQEAERAWQEVRSFWSGLLGQVQVETPDPGFNVLLNGWLLYQSVACRLWARSAFYQSGGAYGFRDQLQDSLALLHTRPEMVREQILLHAAHQFIEGDVQHWWHEETGRGIRTRFSDDLLWLPYAVLRYVEHTGDQEILGMEIPFLTERILAEDEDEYYAETKTSGESGSLFEHCRRAVNRALRFGPHGLPLMGTGDWNDGMNRVGRDGKGESVWLGWFLYWILEKLAPLCEDRGLPEEGQRYREAACRLKDLLNEEAWDGQWYRRAFFDNGQPLGSIQNEECQIDSLPQAWSVISGGGVPEKAKTAMEAVERELVWREHALVRLLTPPFAQTEPSPGYIQGYPQGVRENGGQYTHAAIWNIIAWTQLGEGERAWELFQMINPIHHALTPGEVLRYKAEPYVVAADIYASETNSGRGGWTWYTGAAGWLYQTGLEWILGIRRRGDFIYLNPCIPKHWPEYKVDYKVGSALYKIQVLNSQEQTSGERQLEIDGQVQDCADGICIPVKDDGKEHLVKVLTGSRV